MYTHKHKNKWFKLKKKNHSVWEREIIEMLWLYCKQGMNRTNKWKPESTDFKS